MKRLRALFHEVDSKEPTDWPRLRRQLIKQDVTPATLDQLFHARRTDGGGYQVEILDPEGYKALGDHLGIWADMTDRASAAVHGKSHAVPVSGNLVVVKSPGNMTGYYKMPEKTAEDFTEDGFFKTGDMGEIDEKGRLKITGRIKEQYKLENDVENFQNILKKIDLNNLTNRQKIRHLSINKLLEMYTI